jgi:uncharacterized protein YjiS (DUF1127 family)
MAGEIDGADQTTGGRLESAISGVNVSRRRPVLATLSALGERAKSVWQSWRVRIESTLALARVLLVEWRRRIRSRNELVSLIKRNCGLDLWDIGLTRGQSEAEMRKPFWIE